MKDLKDLFIGMSIKGIKMESKEADENLTRLYLDASFKGV